MKVPVIRKHSAECERYHEPAPTARGRDKGPQHPSGWGATHTSYGGADVPRRAYQGSDAVAGTLCVDEVKQFDRET